MAMDLSEAYVFFDAINYTQEELDIIYGNEPKVKDMKVFNRLLNKCLDHNDDWELYYYLIAKYEVETGELVNN